MGRVKKKKKRSFREKQTRETKARIFQRLNGQKLNLNLDPHGTLAKNKGLLTKMLYRPGCIPHMSEEEKFSETRPSHFPDTEK